MKIRLLNVTPIGWKEQVEMLDAEHELALASEDNWIEEWLGDVDGGEASGQRSMSRVPTPMPNFQRHDASRKVASANNWDEDFKNAQSHVASILAKLGNGRS